MCFIQLNMYVFLKIIFNEYVFKQLNVYKCGIPYIICRFTDLYIYMFLSQIANSTQCAATHMKAV